MKNEIAVLGAIALTATAQADNSNRYNIPDHNAINSVKIAQALDNLEQKLEIKREHTPSLPESKDGKAPKTSARNSAKVAKERILSQQRQDTSAFTAPASVVQLTAVKVVNLKGVRPQTVLNGLPEKRGQMYSPDQLRQTEQNLMNSGFFKEVKAQLQGTELIIRVKEHARIGKLVVKGAKAIKTEEIKHNLDANNIGENGVLNTPLIESFAKELKNEYLNVGKENVQLHLSYDPLTEQEEQALPPQTLKELKENGKIAKVSFDIEEGATTKVKSIRFKGNRHLTENQLKKKLATSEYSNHPISNFFDPTSANFRLNVIQEDLSKVLDLYKENGFPYASIPDVQFEDVGTPDKPMKAIVATINEGKRYLFGKPQFHLHQDVDGLLTSAEADKANRIPKGQWFKRSALTDSEQALKRVLNNKGYPFAEVKFATREDEEGAFVPLLSVKANNPATIRNINITGLTKTQRATILNELRQKEGERYNLDRLEVSEQKLMQSNLFKDVSFEVVPVDAEGKEVDIVINVQEKRTGILNFNAGFVQGQGANIGGAFSNHNIGGTGQSVSLDTSISKTEKAISANYMNPHLLGQDKSLEWEISGNDYQANKSNKVKDYRLTRYGTTATFGLPVGDFNKVYFGLGAEHLDLKTHANAPLAYRNFIKQYGKQDGQSGRFKGWVGKASVSYGVNKTSDPLWGGTGYIAKIGAEATLPKSKLKYAKAEASYKHFLPLSEDLTLMLGAQAGYGQGLGKDKNLPFFNNYNLGGIGGDLPLRGYQNGSLGAKVYNANGEVVALGANRLLGATAELNSKIPYIKDSSNMRLGAFVDLGSVWDNRVYRPSDSDNKQSVYGQNAYRSSFKNELRASAGVAFTWYSPLGAIKFSYAQPLIKKKGDQLEKFQFSIGKTF